MGEVSWRQLRLLRDCDGGKVCPPCPNKRWCRACLCRPPLRTKIRALPILFGPCGISGKQGGILATATGRNGFWRNGQEEGRDQRQEQRQRCQPRLRGQTLARRRQAPQQHGRGGIQARRPRPDLPQIHLRRVRGNARQRLLAGKGDEGADPEDADEYRAENVFWVPKEARWAHLQAKAKQPTIGKIVDDAMVAIERDNPRLKGVLPKDYARPALDKHRLGELIDLIGTIGLGDAENRSKDILGRVYEYFLSQFASAEGKNGGQFYTPRCVVRVLVEMLAPYKGRVYDPVLRLGRHVRAERKIRGGPRRTHRRHRDLRAGIQPHHLAAGDDEPRHSRHRGRPRAGTADSFRRDLHKDLKADYILANPPFNDSDWHRNGRRRALEVWRAAQGQRQLRLGAALHPPPRAQRLCRLRAGQRLACRPTNRAKARSARPSSRPTWWIAWSRCPANCFTPRKSPSASGSSPRNKKNGRFRDRRGETLFIDARKLGMLIDRVHRELTDEDIARIADTYHAWRGDKDCRGKYEDVPGFCKSATLDEISQHGHVLTPGRYVGAEEVEDDGEPFEEKMQRLVAQLNGQFAESRKLEKAIRSNLEGLGYGDL